MHRKNEKTHSHKELKHLNHTRMNSAKFHAKKHDITSEKVSVFLSFLALDSSVTNKQLPVWLITFLLFSHLVEEAAPTPLGNRPQKLNSLCGLTKRSAFFSKTKYPNPATVPHNFTVEPSVYQQFPECSEAEVNDYLTKLSQEALQTNAFSKEIDQVTNEPYKVKFKSPTNSIFSGERGLTDHVEKEITIMVFDSPSQLNAAEHHATVGTYRHEKHHEWKAHTNKKQIPCLLKQNIETKSWIAHPYLPSESNTHLSAWANTIKLGLTRLANGKITPEIIGLYKPRIWSISLKFSEEQAKKIKEDILSKHYSNLVLDYKKESQFKEIEKIFSAKAQSINIYAQKIEKQPDDTYRVSYSYVRKPEDTTIERLLYALVWDIKGRVFQYQIDLLEGKQGFGYNIGEIDAFIAGMHRDITHTVFPEWVDFHKKIYQEAMRCNETSSQAFYKRNEL